MAYPAPKTVVGNAVYTGSELTSSDESIAQEEHGSQAGDDTLSGNLRHLEFHRERVGTNAVILSETAAYATGEGYGSSSVTAVRPMLTRPDGVDAAASF